MGEVVLADTQTRLSFHGVQFPRRGTVYFLTSTSFPPSCHPPASSESAHSLPTTRPTLIIPHARHAVVRRCKPLLINNHAALARWPEGPRQQRRPGHHRLPRSARNSSSSLRCTRLQTRHLRHARDGKAQSPAKTLQHRQCAIWSSLAPANGTAP